MKKFGWVPIVNQDNIDFNFYDSYGAKIKVGDTLIYERKKKGEWHPPAGMVRVRVDEMVVKIASKHNGDRIEMIKGLNVFQIEPKENWSTRFRIYNTIKTIKVTKPAKGRKNGSKV
jgi:hypothetical protein